MIPSQLIPSANHLWQSTLFAGVAGLLTLFLRKNRAHVRYWLWFLASVKFLLPFSILVAVGGLLGRHTTAAVAPSRLVPAADFSSFVEQVGGPFTATVPQFAMPAVQRSYTSVIVPLLILVWAAGFATLVCRWTLRWRRMRAAVSKASPLDLPIGLPVKSSPAFGEPGVFGIFRPVLLLPDRILDCLTAREMESIVAHELCHVQRRDNLATVIHMAVEVVFWFHPLVWWLGARLMEERERACDEEVLRAGGEPREYAEGILKICELYLASPLACVAGVTGGDLKRRIEAIMSNRVARRLNFARKTILATAAIAVVVTPIVVGIMNTPLIQAKPQLSAVTPPPVKASSQRPSGVLSHPDGKLVTPQAVAQSASVPIPKFEVASVKPCSDESTGAVRGGRGGDGRGTPGRLDLSCRTVMSIIQTAHTSGMPPLPPIEGGPAWINSERYVINAKAEGTPSPAIMRGPMLQALLKDRFQLKTHPETREVPGYALTVAKGGPKLAPHQVGSCVDIGLVKPLTTARPQITPGERPAICGANHSGKGTGPNVILDVPGVTLDYFARTFLGIAFWGRPIINKTGIGGLFDIHLEFTSDASTPGPPDMARPPAAATNPDGGPPAADPLPEGPSLSTALQQQLGLKLEPAKGPREVLVIDHVERPSPN